MWITLPSSLAKLMNSRLILVSLVLASKMDIISLLMIIVFPPMSRNKFVSPLVFVVRVYCRTLDNVCNVVDCYGVIFF